MDDGSNLRVSDAPPTEAEVRDALLRRATAYCELVGTSLTKLGAQIKKDKDLFHRIRKGGNFTIGQYTDLMTWLTENWPKAVEEKASEQV